MDTDEGLTLKELCEEASVSERTIRYYMTQGLVPPAPRSGPGVRYSRRYLARLKLIRRWQDEYFPLEHIRKLLADLSDGEIERLANAPGDSPRREPTTPPSSAADYVRSVLGRTPKPEAPAALFSAVEPQRPETVVPRKSETSRAETPEPKPEPELVRSQWERWVLDEDIELHIRRPLSHPKNRRVEALLAEARRILKPRS